MTYKRNLLIAFGFSLLLLIISSIVSFMSIRNLLTSSDWVNHTNQVIKALNDVNITIKDAEAGQRGYLLTGDPKFLMPYNGALDRLRLQMDEVTALTADNDVQEKDVVELKRVLEQRMAYMQTMLDTKRNTGELAPELLTRGKDLMDQAKTLMNRISTREQSLLAIRMKDLNRLASFTPPFIVVAALLSILITLSYFLKLNADHQQREKLRMELQQKDEEINRRISVIQDLANKISEGQYDIRVTDEAKDDLGSLSFALNRMAATLDRSFQTLTQNDWLHSGIRGLHEKMVGERSMEELSYNILEYVTNYTGSHAGALYIADNGSHFQLHATYALHENALPMYINPGEGLAGQAAAGRQPIFIDNIPQDQIRISFSTAELNPKSVVAYPLIFEGNVKAVLELASINEYSESHKAFLAAVSTSTGIVIQTTQNRKELQRLLEYSQSQAEELLSQQSELENLNTELEAQAQKLQASEEELKVQHEELQQSNSELEERSRLLEERNQVIGERNAEIQRKAEELALSSRYKSEFLANMSHELRTPLNSILLLSRLMSENHEKNLSPEQVEYAQVIRSSGQGLLSLIDEILDLSKIESGKMELEVTSVRLKEIFENMRALFQALAKEKGLEFHIEADASAPSTIETDKLRLEQIIRNLLSNAFKFTEKGSVTLSVVRVHKESPFIAISVRDTGIGIAPEKQQLVFEAFQQADGSTRRKYGGTGLGLSISRELVKLLGGDIRVNSEPGKGSEFIVYIPERKLESHETLKIKATEQEPLAEQPLPQPKERKRLISDVIPDPIPDDSSDIGPNDKTLLIVEDDLPFARALLDYSRSKGYKGIVSVRGDEAIEKAKKFKPMGILLDIQLPVKDGWEVMEEIKSDPEIRHIPVHIMSSHEVKKESLQRGAVDFINKPVAFEQMNQIFEKLEKVINREHKKVLIVEENPQHAKALAYFLGSYEVNTEISASVNEGVTALKKDEVDCVILDMGIPDKKAYDTLENVKKNPGLEHLPIIIFTGKSLSRNEEQRIRQYADSIVIKTAHSYQRILDEVSLFLHLVEQNTAKTKEGRQYRKLGMISEVLAEKKVLIVDDDVRNIFSLTKALESHKVNVLSAGDGKDALKVLSENPDMDLVLMDIMMPVMDGYEAIRELRKNKRFRNLPVIAVTAKAMTGDREKCIQAGASDYISKPVDIDQLLSLLRVWLYEK